MPGEGPLDPRFLLVGEAPGEREDAEGRPFRGRAGAFLDGLFDAAGLTRAEIFLTSAVKCRPPGNRDPRRDELDACRARWLERQIDLVNPPLIVLTGRIPALSVLGATGNLAELRGRVRRRAGRRVFVTYHPAAGMRFPRIGEALRADFRKIARLTPSG